MSLPLDLSFEDTSILPPIAEEVGINNNNGMVSKVFIHFPVYLVWPHDGTTMNNGLYHDTSKKIVKLWKRS